MAYNIIRPRRGIKSLWDQYKGRIYKQGEMLVESPETGVGSGLVNVKFGDGVTDYENLPYAIMAPTDEVIPGGEAPVNSKAVENCLSKTVSNYLPLGVEAVNGSYDFNNLTKAGIYRLNTWAGSGGANLPPMQIQGILIIHNSSGFVQQFALSGNNLYARNFDGETWSEWGSGFHTTNTKPKGTYVGNGSATSRDISVGGIGDVCVILSAYGPGFTIATRYGAILKNYNSLSSLPTTQCHFTNGVLTITSTNGDLNANGTTYTYLVL